MIVDFYCGRLGFGLPLPSVAVSLLGWPNTSRSLWRVREVTYHLRSNHYTLGPVVAITTAWYGVSTGSAPT